MNIKKSLIISQLKGRNSIIFNSIYLIEIFEKKVKNIHAPNIYATLYKYVRAKF